MTEPEFDAAFQDLISRPWPSAKEGARSEAANASNAPVEGVYPILAAPRVFPDFGARPIGGTHGTHPGTHPRGGSRGGRSQNFRDRLGTCATVAHEGSPVPWCVDINTPDEPAALGFSHVDINTTAPRVPRTDIKTRPEPAALGFSRTDIGTRAA